MAGYRIFFLIVLSTTVLCCHTSDAGSPRQLVSLTAGRSPSKIPRSIRAPFRNTEMMTARGFGKRGNGIQYPMGLNVKDSKLFSFDNNNNKKFLLSEMPNFMWTSMPKTKVHTMRTRDLKFRLDDGNLRIGRGFGKRTIEVVPDNLQNDYPYNYFKHDTRFYDGVSSDQEQSQQYYNGMNSESYPNDWLTEEIKFNPILAKMLIHRFIDNNRDGALTANELITTSSEHNDIY